MEWKKLLAYITGSVDQELLLRNEYLVTENRMLRNQLQGRVRLTDTERKTLAEIGMKLGKQALEEVATIVKPDTILAWHRKLVAQKFDGSQQRQSPGRPKIDQELEPWWCAWPRRTAVGATIALLGLCNILDIPSVPRRWATS
jgi:putative transposase